MVVFSASLILLEKTKVIFRQWKIGCEIIALFPEIATDTIGYNCQSYMHVGQHGAANPNIIADTKPANLEDGAVKSISASAERSGTSTLLIRLCDTCSAL